MDINRNTHVREQNASKKVKLRKNDAATNPHSAQPKKKLKCTPLDHSGI